MPFQLLGQLPEQWGFTSHLASSASEQAAAGAGGELARILGPKPGELNTAPAFLKVQSSRAMQHRSCVIIAMLTEGHNKLRHLYRGAAHQAVSAAQRRLDRARRSGLRIA